LIIDEKYELASTMPLDLAFVEGYRKVIMLSPSAWQYLSQFCGGCVPSCATESVAGPIETQWPECAPGDVSGAGSIVHPSGTDSFGGHGHFVSGGKRGQLVVLGL
jgi:hypothetical protein